MNRKKKLAGWWWLWCFALLVWGPGAVWAATAPVVVDDAPTLANFRVQIDEVAKQIEQVRKALAANPKADSLPPLTAALQEARRNADGAANRLEPQLAQVLKRIEQLGASNEEQSEEESIRVQRQELGQERSELDAAIKRGKLLAVEATQLSASIDQLRSRQFGARISARVGSPLSPALWQQLWSSIGADGRQLQALAQQAWTPLQQAAQNDAWPRLLLAAGLAVLLMFPLRLWLRNAGERWAVSSRAPSSRLRRTALAVWKLAIGTVLPGMAWWVLLHGLRSAQAIAPPLVPVAQAFVTAAWLAAFVVALSASLLAPGKPTWRLLNIDNQAVADLRRHLWWVASWLWLALVWVTLDQAADISEVTGMAVDGVLALGFALEILLILRVLQRMKRREPSPDAEPRPNVKRSGWLMAAWLGGHLAVLAAVAAVLLGYLNFALFATTQMVWITLVVLCASLLMRFVDDLALWWLSPQSRSGRALLHSLGMSESLVAQAGVLLSAVVRVLVLLLGIAAIAAPYGDVRAVTGWTDILTTGVRIGSATIKPLALLRALAVLLVVLGIMKAVRHWLDKTYLPKTQLDIGARNSISTVTRYVGIILAVLWALAALGVGFQRVALLASALSVGIGFGLQAITQNFVSGLILLAERPVKLGDRIRIGEHEGDIRRISVRATEIQLSDRSSLIVPNSELITKSVHNLTMGDVPGRIQIRFGVPLSTNVALLQRILLDIYTAHDAVLQEPAPSFYIDSIASGAIVVNSFAYASSPRSTYAVRSDLLFSLLQQLAEQGIALSTPTDLHVITDAPVPGGRSPAGPQA